MLPKGPVTYSSGSRAESVQASRSALGQRLVVRGRIGGLLRYTQTLTLWEGIERVDCRTTSRRMPLGPPKLCGRSRAR